MKQFVVTVAAVGALWGGVMQKAGAASAADDSSSTGSGSSSASGFVKPRSSRTSAKIAHFHLRGELQEQTQEDPFGFSAASNPSLRDMLRRLEKARKDANVKAVVLTWGDMHMGVAQMEELRGALLKFREAGKPVIVHIAGQGPEITLPRYALLSAASEISLEPTSDLWLTGLYVESPYFKDLLAKIGVEADFLQKGAYKSAAEMLSRSEPTKEAHENTNWLVDSLYDTFIGMVAEGRKLSPDRVKQLIDGGPYKAEKAKELGLIDAISDRRTFLDSLKKKFEAASVDNAYGEKAKPTVDLDSPFALFSLLAQMAQPPKRTGKPAVGIVYVEGMIVPGYSEPSPFGSGTGIAYGEDVRRALEEAADDKDVKTIVLRVDSPGGSAIASEVILRAAKRAKEKKPMVVSMGNVAGSGGYYVAMSGAPIYADSGTITASIGVVSGKFITQGMWQKLGSNWVEYKRGKNSDLFSSSRRYNETQRKLMSDWMEDIYGVFRQHVQDARGTKLKKPLEELAGGRVFTGKQAKELGLIDEIGGFEAAVQAAAKEAGLSEGYEVRVVPDPKNPLQEAVEEISGKGGRKTDLEVRVAGVSVGNVGLNFSALPGRESASASVSAASRAANAARGLAISAEGRSLLEAALPLMDVLDRPRTRAVVRMLQKLQLLQTEGVLMVTLDELVIR